MDLVKQSFPDVSWIADKKVQNGCSKRRPDLLLDLGTHVIIIEVDENKHDTYDCSCENKRLMELSQDLDHRSVNFLRFNPDHYIDKEKRLIKSCWSYNSSFKKKRERMEFPYRNIIKSNQILDKE